MFFVWKSTQKTKCVYKVIEITSPSEYVVDFNRNGKKDAGETVKPVAIEGFEKIFSGENKIYLSKKLNYNDVIKGYFFSVDFLKENLLNKGVEVRLFEGSSENYAQIFCDGKDVSKTLLKNGYAIVKNDSFMFRRYLKFEDVAKIKNNAEKQKDLDFVILNKSTKTYHEIDCKYIEKLKEYEIVKRENISNDIHPCPHCDLRWETQKNQKEGKDAPPLILGDLELYILDFINHPKPDKTCKNYGCKRLIELIDNSKSSIDIAVYSIHNQPKVVDALVRANKRGVKIRMVADAKTYVNSPDDYKRLETITDKISYAANGSGKTSRYTMHNKFMIFDEETVFTGSANLTRTDLSGFNANNLIVVRNKNFANVFGEEFNQMYEGKFAKNKKKIDSGKIMLNGGIPVSIHFSPNGKVIENEIIPRINQAKKSVLMPCFVITDKNLANALKNAAKRGVEVKIILDATSAGNRYTIHEDLRKSGISVKVENLAGKMHFKTVIIDGIFVITGSGNFSHNAESFNDEAALIIESSKLAGYYTDYFRKVWNFIPNKWLSANPKAESLDSIGSCFDTVDNDFDDKKDSEDEGCVRK